MPALISKLLIVSLYLFMPTILSWWFNDYDVNKQVPFYAHHLAWIGIIAATYLVTQWLSKNEG